MIVDLTRMRMPPQAPSLPKLRRSTFPRTTWRHCRFANSLPLDFVLGKLSINDKSPFLKSYLIQWMCIHILEEWKDHPQSIHAFLQLQPCILGTDLQLKDETSLWTVFPLRRRGRWRRPPTRPSPPTAAGRWRSERRRCSWCSRPPWKLQRWGRWQSWAFCGGRGWWGEWWSTSWHWRWRAPAMFLSTGGRHSSPENAKRKNWEKDREWPVLLGWRPIWTRRQQAPPSSRCTSSRCRRSRRRAGRWWGRGTARSWCRRWTSSRRSKRRRWRDLWMGKRLGKERERLQILLMATPTRSIVQYFAKSENILSANCCRFKMSMIDLIESKISCILRVPSPSAPHFEMGLSLASVMLEFSAESWMSPKSGTHLPAMPMLWIV